MDEPIFDEGPEDELSDFGEPPPPLLETAREEPPKRQRKPTSQKQLDHLSRIREKPRLPAKPAKEK